MKLLKIKNKKVRFAITATIYTLIVIWIGNYFLLPGLAIIYDHYFTRKVKWMFWKRWDSDKVYLKEKKGSLREWIDALIFAVVAAYLIRLLFIEAYTIPTSSLEKTLLRGDYLFVSKIHYGPRLPMTPIAFPFVHHSLPASKTKKSYVEWIKMPFKRLCGLEIVENNDIVVFNYPDGDTLTVEHQSNYSYYQMLRQSQLDLSRSNPELTNTEKHARDYIWDNYTVISRPVDKRENYVKRCIAIPGDTLQIKSGQVYLNGKAVKNPENLQHNYIVYFKPGKSLNPATLKRLDITEVNVDMYTGNTIMTLTKKNMEKISKFPVIDSIKIIDNSNSYKAMRIFPYDTANYKWTEDDFGPLPMPKKGYTVKLNINNISLYKRVIDVYENNDLRIDGNKIYINGKETDSYTFKLDYYWMMGDNRHNSADSRFWGFVPNDHIVGKPVFIWLSIDPDRKWNKIGKKIRWNRLFNTVHNEDL